ncbi:MAG: hypothetical protein AAGG75_02905 [Bacteroidota bacterium]
MLCPNMILLLDMIVVSKFVLILIIAGFMPLSSISFFRHMMPKKEKEYNKAIKEMGIKTNRTVADTYNYRRYFLPVSFVTLICLLYSTYFTFANTFVADMKDSLLLTGAFFGGTENKALMEQSMSVLTYAFLGGFIWSAQTIIRRLINNDLPPSVYYSAGIRILLASAVALVLSFVIGEEGSSNIIKFKSSLAAIAFLTGMFPERVLSYLITVYQKFVNPDEMNTKQLSLERLEGISMQHKERLEEIGIDNAQNLATSSLTQLCVETPFEARMLLDWIGQAKLLCYFKDDIEKIRGVGIRSVFDFFLAPKTAQQLQALAQAAGVSKELLQNVYQEVINDRGIQALYGFLSGVNTPNEEVDNQATTATTANQPKPANTADGTNPVPTADKSKSTSTAGKSKPTTTADKSKPADKAKPTNKADKTDEN